MVLSNRERQAIYRARKRESEQAIAALVDEWKRTSAGLKVQLNMLERGIMHTRTDGADTTAATLERVRGHLGKFEQLIAKYEGPTDDGS
jgi:hypothetical protein